MINVIGASPTPPNSIPNDPTTGASNVSSSPDIPLSPTPELTKTNSLSNNKPKKRKRKIPLKYILGGIIFLILIIGGGTALYLTQISQDTRQQASGDEYTCPANTGYYRDAVSCGIACTNTCVGAGNNCCPTDDYCPAGTSPYPDAVRCGTSCAGTCTGPSNKCCPSTGTATPAPTSVAQIPTSSPTSVSSGGGGENCGNYSAANCQGKSPGYICDNNPPGSGVCVELVNQSSPEKGIVCTCRRDNDPTPTSGSNNPTPTTDPDSPTPTSGSNNPTPTTDPDSPTPTSGSNNGGGNNNSGINPTGDSGSIVDTGAGIGEQPDLPNELYETGPEDWLNYLKAGLGVLGVGAILLLFL